jgi:hypothetical protein
VKEETVKENEPNTEMGEPIDVLKHKVRTAAAHLERPIGLDEATARVCGPLSATEAMAIAVDTVTEWIMSLTEEMAIVPGRGTMLLGPAPSPDDADAWEDD